MNRHVATRITGPRHNYLSITFATPEENQEPEIVTLPAQGECTHAQLDKEKIMECVLEGVAEANKETDRQFRVKAIEYVENDTGPEKTYQFMASEIVKSTVAEERHANENFQKQFGKKK